MTGSRETGTELNGRNPGELFAKPDVRVTRRADGTMLLSAAEPLDRYGRSMNEHLVDWAHSAKLLALASANAPEPFLGSFVAGGAQGAQCHRCKKPMAPVASTRSTMVRSGKHCTWRGCSNDNSP